MRRFVILLLLWVLPIQFGLAATVDALQHARDGHMEFASGHSHAVVFDDAAKNVDGDNDADASAKSHGECGACHCFHSLAFLGEQHHYDFPAAKSAMTRVNSADHTNDFTGLRPDRPQWLFLA